MPEGHTLHRLAGEVSRCFGGRVVGVSSPQGRFADAAALLDRTRLVAGDAWGKHLFMEFEHDHVVHIHLGLVGRLDVCRGVPPAPVGQVRMRLVAPPSGASPDRAAYADLRGAAACALVTPDQREAVIRRLGPDPLRADADPDRAWRRVSRSPRPVGDLLMDQSVVAGVGNVYRAEVLFRHRMHPLRPGRTLLRRQFASLWQDLVALMTYGLEVGRIDTVRAEHTPEAMGRPPRVDDHGGEVYVYRRTGEPCLVCGRRVRTAALGGRNVFWCSRCQPAFRSRALQ